MSEWKRRRDAAWPYQDRCWFDRNAIVQVRSAQHPHMPDQIGPAGSFWWGYEEDLGGISDGTIVAARQLSKSKRTGLLAHR